MQAAQAHVRRGLIMATTVTQGFNTFKSNLQISELQSSTVSTRQKNVREAVEKELIVLKSFLTGSYSRSTMIAPLKKADIDVFVVLDTSYYESAGQAKLLDRVKRVLKRTYPSTHEISRSGQAVTITFSDFKVDVVPAFNRSGGGYVIPSTIGPRWISTDPTVHVTISSKCNADHNGRLVPLVKMIKKWNLESGALFRSFHLEVLAWQVLNGVTISDYPSGVRYYFDKCRSYIKQTNPDPAGYGGDVGYYLNSSNIDSAVSRFTTAYNRAIKAEEYAAAGKTAEAIAEWRKVFGDRFPAYG